MEFLTYAIIGGLLPDAIRLIKNRHGSLPDYLTNLNFYIGVLLLVGLGVFAVYLKEPSDKVEALAIGFSAPQVVSSLLGNKLNLPSDEGNESMTESRKDSKKQGLVTFLRNWW